MNLLDGTSPEWNHMAQTRDQCLSFTDMLSKFSKKLKNKLDLLWLVNNFRLKVINLLSVLMTQQITPVPRLNTTSTLEVKHIKTPSTSFQGGWTIPQIKKRWLSLKKRLVVKSLNNSLKSEWTPQMLKKKQLRWMSWKTKQWLNWKNKATKRWSKFLRLLVL